MDDARTYPLPICHAVPGAGEHAGRIVFIRWTLPSKFVVRWNVEEIWQLWELCNGRKSIKQICESVSFDRSLARRLLAMLMEQELLTDESQHFGALHALTMNPRSPGRFIIDESAALSSIANPGMQQGGQVAGVFDNLKTGALFDILRRQGGTGWFSGQGLTHDQLGRLLVQTYSIKYKTTASPGDSYPLRIYFMLSYGQAGLSEGLYQFNPFTHSITRLAGLDEQRVREFAFNSGTLLGKAPLVVVIAASPYRHTLKYGNRGDRLTNIETGMAAQNLITSAGEIGMSALLHQEFNDVALAGMFGMDPTLSRPLQVVAVGYPRQGVVDGHTAAATLERIKEGLSGVNVSLVGATIEPHGGYQVRVRLSDSKVGSFTGMGVASSLDAARITAMAEAYERRVIAAFNRVDMVCPASLLSEKWIDPRLAAPTTPWQQSALGLSAFDPSAQWQWVAGKDMATGKSVLVPFDMVGYAVQEKFNRPPCVLNCSSGVAVHTTKKEATRRALLELLERDALMRYWLMRRTPTRIHLEALPQSLQKRVVQLQAQGRSVDVLNFSNDGYSVAVIGVAIHGAAYPCFVLSLASSDQDWQVAAIKAFIEADLTGWPSAPGGVLSVADVTSPKQHALLYAQPGFAHNALWLCDGDFGPVPSVRPLAEIVDTLSPVVVDLTGADAPFVGVRVVCQKLVPISFRYRGAYHMHSALGKVVEAQVDLPVPFG